ncbi:MAG: peptidylprolyl isomerase [Rhodobacteraceae bacterium CG17_big_fil_post_rev_8_21_14_2_50_65_11]|nr:MAG: peptidylprolyl isomerase [Rhodobacteraceae bacterium CG17_big_fil_post_rev_8_21_14_2_50_65_11]
MARRAGKKLSDFIVWILLGLLIVGLAGFGIGNFGGSTTQIGSVGNATISANAYARALQVELRAQAAEGGPYTTLAGLQSAGLDRAILDGLVARAALTHEAGEIGLSVGDEEVARQIRNSGSFQGPGGSFDRATYELQLSQAGYGIAEFEDTIREDTARSILQAAIIGGLDMPDSYIETMVAYQTETRSFTLARVTENDLPSGLAAPDDADLQAYFDENGQRFERPEIRRITYAWVTPNQIQDDMEVSEQALRDLYEDRRAEYVQPERRLLERLVFPTQEEAEAARAALDADETDFDTLVADRGLTLDDVDLGETSPRDLSAAAREVIFADTEAEILGPLESRFGPALFRINAVLDATEVPFEVAQDDLRTELAGSAARRAIDDVRDVIDDLLAGGATLEEVTQETEMTLGRIDWSDGADTGIAAYEAFGEAAAAAQPGDFPELVPLSDGGQFALRLDEVVPPAIPPLAEIEDEVAAAWRATQLRIRLEEHANAILGDLALSGSLDDLGLALTTEARIRRQSFIPDTPPTLVAQVFQLEAPGDMVVVAGPRAAYIVRLDEIHSGTRGSPEMQALEGIFARQATNSLTGDVFEAFGQALQAEVGISLDPAVINAIHAQFP